MKIHILCEYTVKEIPCWFTVRKKSSVGTKTTSFVPNFMACISLKFQMKVQSTCSYMGVGKNISSKKNHSVIGNIHYNQFLLKINLMHRINVKIMAGRQILHGALALGLFKIYLKKKILN